MKLYTVEHRENIGEYTDTVVMGIFSTKNKAEEYIKYITSNKNRDKNCWYVILRDTLNNPKNIDSTIDIYDENGNMLEEQPI